MDKTTSRTVGFCDQYVTIHSHGSQAAALVDFLCSDLLADKPVTPRATYDLMAVGKKPMLSLWEGEKQLYFGECRYSLAYTLINEVIYQCLAENSAGHALHAAAVCCGNSAILLPGKSGAGKSTLTAWLTANGCTYLTDELIVISGEDHRIHPFTRPLSIKKGSQAVFSSFFNFDRNLIVSGPEGQMIPHRLLNPDFQAKPPPLSLILFPEYKAGACTTITKLTAAVGCSRLIECYVNARNIRGHGISKLAEVTRSVPVYQLTYGSFDGLKTMLFELFAGDAVKN